MPMCACIKAYMYSITIIIHQVCIVSCEHTHTHTHTICVPTHFSMAMNNESTLAGVQWRLRVCIWSISSVRRERERDAVYVCSRSYMRQMTHLSSGMLFWSGSKITNETKQTWYVPLFLKWASCRILAQQLLLLHLFLFFLCSQLFIQFCLCCCCCWR